MTKGLSAPMCKVDEGSYSSNSRFLDCHKSRYFFNSYDVIYD